MDNKTTKRVNEATSITINRACENRLTGLKVSIPPYPKQGDIVYKGNKVGYASNFNGVCLKDKNFITLFIGDDDILWFNA